MKEYLNKAIKLIRKYSIPLLLVWLIIVVFLGIDGISRNLYSLDLDFFFKGIYNNRVILFLPIWIILLFKITKDKESQIGKFLDDHSVLVFIVLLNVSNIVGVLPYENYLSYIIRLFTSFFVVVAIIPFVRKILKSLNNGYHFDEEKKGDNNKEWNISKKEIIWIVILIMGAIVSRFVSIDGLSPTTDEYLHLGQAKKEIFPENVLYNNGEYKRAYFITWIIKFLFENFRMTISIGRLPGVIVSCITVVLFYLLLRKENKTMAILTSFLYAFSPWSIMLSRTIREYIYFLPLFLLLGIYVYKRVKKIIERNYKIKDAIFDILVFFAVSYYCFFIDPLSTAKFSLIIYLGGFVYWLINRLKEKHKKEDFKIDKKSRKRIVLFLTSMFVILVLANRFFGLSIEISQINIIPSFDASWVGYIFSNNEYGSLILGWVFLLAGLIPSVTKLIREDKPGLSEYISIAFLVIVYFFTFHFGRYYRPRYISIALPFIIYLQADGFLFLRNFLCNEFKFCNKKNLLLLLLLVNWVYVFYGFLIDGTGYVKVSQEFHEGYEVVYEEIKNVDDGYVLVTTLPDAADWYFDDGITEIISLSYSDVNMESILDEIVSSHEKGFFVIDSRRNTWAGNIFKLDRTYTTISGYKLKFISSTDVYMIYEWDNSIYASKEK